MTTPDVSSNSATVRVRARVQNDLAEGRDVTLTTEILDNDAAKVATTETRSSAPPGTVREFDQNVADADGNVVPMADNPVTFEIEGAASLIGVDNGDPASHDDYRARQRRAFNGMALAIVQARRNAGRARVRVVADGLKEATVELNVRAAGGKAFLP